MKYLIYASNHVGAIIDMPSGVKTEGWGEIQALFVRLHGPPEPGPFQFYADMIHLCEGNRVSGIYYDYELAGSDGANFRVISMPDSLWSSLRDCCANIRRNRDVVRLSILPIANIVDFQVEVDEIAKKYPECVPQKAPC